LGHLVVLLQVGVELLDLVGHGGAVAVELGDVGLGDGGGPLDDGQRADPLVDGLAAGAQGGVGVRRLAGGLAGPILGAGLHVAGPRLGLVDGLLALLQRRVGVRTNVTNEGHGYYSLIPVGAVRAFPLTATSGADTTATSLVVLGLPPTAFSRRNDS